MNSDVNEIWLVKKTESSKDVYCKLYFCRDGSLYVDGDNAELVLEGPSSTVVEAAVRRMQDLGYMRCW